MSERPAITVKQLRGTAARASSPITMIVLGLFAVAGALGAFTALDMNPDQVAQAESGVMLVVIGIVWLVQRRDDTQLEAKVASAEQAAFRDGLFRPQPKARDRRGARGEGGPVVVEDDETPVTDPARVDREG